MTGKQRIAIYDLDRTITARPTYSHFLLRSAWRTAPLRLFVAPVVPAIMALYKLKVIDRDRLKVWMWALLLGRADPGRLDRAVTEFVNHTLDGNIRTGALSRIREDRTNGALLVLATAAPELYAKPIADALGIDAVVATRVAVADDGRVGPSLLHGNVYGQAKLVALERFLEERRIGRADAVVSFYSDSVSDRPVFDWCDAPVVIAPSRRFARRAASLGWTVTAWGRCEPVRPSRDVSPTAPTGER